MGNFSEILISLKEVTPWPADFPATLDDDLARSAAVSMGRNPGATFDFAQIETLLRDASRSLDRCLGYRKEFMDLAAAAMTFALDQQYQDGVNSKLEALETAAWSRRLRDVEATAQDRVEAAYAELDADLAPGLSASARAAAVLARAAADEEDGRAALIEQKWRIIESHRANVRRLHEESGNPLAFTDRARRVSQLVLEDFSEAVAKLAAAAHGMTASYPIILEPILIDENKPLDAAVNWAREAIRRWEAALALRFETEVTFRLLSCLPKIQVDPPVVEIPGGGFFQPQPAPAPTFVEMTNLASFQHGPTVTIEVGAGQGVLQTDAISTVGCRIVLANAGGLTFPTFVVGEVEVQVPGYPLPGGPAGAGSSSTRFSERPPVRFCAVSVEPPKGGSGWCDSTLVRHTLASGSWRIALGEIRYPLADVAIDWSKVRDVIVHVRVMRIMEKWSGSGVPE